MASALTGASHALRPRPGRPLTRSRGARRRGQALDAELAARASAWQKTRWSPDRGDFDNRSCVAILENGGFWVPWLP